MKFMVSWEVHPERRLEVLGTWVGLSAEDRANVGPGVRLIGRWHNLAEYTGVAIFETDDVSALSTYLGQWNPVMDLQVSPVLDDEESAAAGQAMLDAMAQG